MIHRKFLPTLLAMVVTPMTDSALASSYHVFTDATGGKALSNGKLEAAERSFKGSLDFADQNNLCVSQAINGEVSEAKASCSIALDLVKSTRLSVRRRALLDIAANLATLEGAITDSVQASDD